MFSWQAKQRMKYLTGLSVLILLVAGLVYYLSRPDETCFDDLANQDETGIDCGGSCERICSSAVAPLKVLWVRPFAVTPDMYSVVALIENPNLDYGVAEFEYNLHLSGETGETIITKNGTAQALAKDQFIIFESNLITEESVARAFIDISDDLYWQELEIQKPSLSVVQKEFTREPSPKLRAIVSNQSVRDLSDVMVVVVLSDSSGNAFAVSRTIVELLPRLSEREIFFTWPQPFDTSPTFVDFYPLVSDF